jgi:hypothetical protein
MIQSSSFVAVALRLIAGKYKREVWVPSKWHHVRLKFHPKSVTSCTYPFKAEVKFFGATLPAEIVYWGF